MQRDKLYIIIKKRGRALFIALVFTLFFVMLFESLIRAQSNKLNVQNQIELISYGNLLKSGLDRELNSLIFIPNGLSSFLNIYHDELQPRKVNAVLADLYMRTRHVRNLAIAVDYKITYIYPIEGNKQALGVDYRELEDQWPKVKEAVDTGTGVLAGPVNLVQGGEALIYRYPVFIDGEYWGLISTVINTDTFIDAAFSNILSDRFNFAIRNVNADGTYQPAFHGDNSLFKEKNALLLETKIPSGKWQWAITRTAEGGSSNLFGLLRFAGLAVSIIFGITLYTLLSERSKFRLQAMYDSLTGLANRRLLNDRAAQAIIQAKRFNRYLALMYIDLDHFKDLNDTYGHAFGDSFLIEVAEKLGNCIRQADTLSRIGGDEFVIVLEEISSPESAALVAQNIINTFSEPMMVGTVSIKVTLSIGIAIYQPSSDDNIDDLMHKADLALYEVKAKGRDGFKVFNY